MKTTPHNRFFILSLFVIMALLTGGEAQSQTTEPAPTATAPEPAPAPSGTVTNTSVTGSGSYPALYQNGGGPFKEKTKVTIQKSGESYTIVPSAGAAWNISLQDIRGVTPVATGIWFYWYDAAGNTLNCFFKMDNASMLSDEINTSVVAYHNRPRDQEAEFKAKYQSYEQEALKEAK